MRNATQEKPTVLVVDDNDYLLRATSRILSKDYTVLTASSGDEAIEIFRKKEPDACVCDVAMPGGTGKDVYEVAQEMKTGFHRRIIFVTGGGFSPVLNQFITERRGGERERENGDDRVLDKPCKPAELRWFVAEMILAGREKVIKVAETPDGFPIRNSEEIPPAILGSVRASTTGHMPPRVNGRKENDE